MLEILAKLRRRRKGNRLKSRSGASRKRYFTERMSDGFKTWLLQHMQAAVYSLGQLARNPGGSLMTIAVIGIALALPAGFTWCWIMPSASPAPGT